MIGFDLFNISISYWPADSYQYNTISGAYFGVSAGDVNGDGLADIAGGRIYSGTVDIYRGGSGVPPTGMFPWIDSRGSRNDLFGYDVDLHGDYNGDGLADLVIGHPSCTQYEPSNPPYPDSYVHYGTPAGPSVPVSWRWSWVAPDNQCVNNVAAAGDLNGDGYDELVVSGEGEAWVVYGSPTGLSDRATSLGERVPFTWGRRTEEVWSEGLGDVNGDGYDDLLYAWSETMEVFLGGPDGVLERPVWSLALDVNHPGRRGFGAGDLNGDGLDDIIAGSPWADVGEWEQAGVLGFWSGRVVDDIDGDGFLNGDDCEPHRSWAYPGAVELPGNDIDEDCDGLMLCHLDEDGDGYAGAATVSVAADNGTCTDQGAFTEALDCWDADAALGPQAAELAHDDVDQDCDGYVLCFGDLDGDGFGGPEAVEIVGAACSTAADYAPDGQDCDDTRWYVNPGQAEVPNNPLDEDCDGVVGCSLDADGDTFGDPWFIVGSPDTSCLHPYMTDNPSDCDDGDPTVYPRAPEIADDEVDQDCDGADGCYQDRDGDGWGGFLDQTELSCVGHPNPLVVRGIPGGDCDDWRDEVNPDRVDDPFDDFDNNCDGLWSCYTSDADGDGYGGPGDAFAMDVYDPPPGRDYCGSPYVLSGDCAPLDPLTRPYAPTSTIGLDRDCDGEMSCAADEDGDGFGRLGVLRETPLTCDEPGLAWDETDCDDGDPLVSPAGSDVPGSGVDGDCDGRVTCWVDTDGDGYGSLTSVVVPGMSCDVPGAAWASGDCRPQNPAWHPGALDVPGDGVDADCDGLDTFHLTITPSPAAAGQQVTLEVRGAVPGRTVWLARSGGGPGAGPCPAALAGACVGMTGASVAAAVPADAAGRVTRTFAAPSASPLWVQALSVDRAGVGATSAVVPLR